MSSRFILFVTIFLHAFLFTVSGDLTFSIEQNYRTWGWDSAHVITNGIITAGIYPQLGGRMMQFDLGEESFIWVNEQEKGRTPQITTGSWTNYGGFKNWPAPQRDWNSGGWPPPPYIDGGKYAISVLQQNADSLTLLLDGQTEEHADGAKGLQFKRILTFYANSSRIRIDQRLLNISCQKTSWSVWDISQLIINHEQNNNYSDFWAYFPRNSRTPNEPCFFTLTEAPADTPLNRLQIREGYRSGIDAFQCNNKGMKIGITTDRGWIAYVDEKNGAASIKTVSVVDGAYYPDNGSVFQIYTTPSTDQNKYIEIEALSPIVDIAIGDSSLFIENWYATRTFGPILEVNKAGAIHEKLTISQNHTIRGKYGVFYNGRVDLISMNSAMRKSYSVTPLDSFILHDSLLSPSGPGIVYLLLYDSDGTFIDTLDKSDFTVQIAQLERKTAVPAVIFDPLQKTVHYQSTEKWSVLVFDISGKLVLKKNGTSKGWVSIPVSRLNKGTYICHVQTRSGKILPAGKLVLSE